MPITRRNNILIAISSIFALGMILSILLGTPGFVPVILFAATLAPMLAIDQYHKIKIS